MVVVSNTSPINYLVQIGLVHLLEPLFGKVLIPRAVADELQDPGAPAEVRAFLAPPPVWLDIRANGEIAAHLYRLDPGERAAIALAGAERADLVLLDERKARIAAKELGLTVAGTLGILDLAARRGLVDPDLAIERLAKTNYRIRPDLLQSLGR